MKGKIMYCAMPTRLQRLKGLAKKIARRCGYAPTVPFDVGAFKDFEGGRIGRERTLKFMIGYMRLCQTVGIFGISDGVMGELKDALDEGKEIRVFYGLDPEWEKMYEQLKGKYSDLFARLRGKNHLIALVGPRCVGKTFWSDRLLEKLKDQLLRVKNTTTREPRDKKDHDSYRFISKKEFRKGIGEYQFLEWDKYQGCYYGSSLKEIRKVLDRQSGIFAITPKGAAALNGHRLEINLTIILLVPESVKTLRKNFVRRNITDPKKQAALIEDAKTFVLPENIRHHRVEITGDTKKDERKIMRIVEPLVAK